MNPFYPGIAFIAVFLLFTGVLFLWIFRKKLKSEYSGKTGLDTQEYMNHSGKFENMQEDYSRQAEIIEKIPMIVRTLSENLPVDAIPRIIVRAAKELFHASKVGYFTRAMDSNEFVLLDRSGYPPDMMIKVKHHAEEIILGMAVQKRMIISRDDLLVYPGGDPEGSSFESQGIDIDIVAPTYVNSQNIGVLVLGGCGVDITSERKYVAMLADLASLSLQNAMKKDLLESASLDDLTGLYNRRYFTRWFETEMRRAKNYLLPLSLFMFDIDHFKAVNDTHGHNAGDLVLKKLGKVIRHHTRSSDLVARYGGEEFVVIMTSSGREQALVYANNLREKIAETKISVPGVEHPISVTISGAVASFPIDGDSPSDLIHAADHVLYGAKRKRRNEVFLA
jgi:diguanylate cyclase (GGDEF)-like protein